MGSNVIRLTNGGTIQVRTGVLQGIGPQGPTGPVGPDGPDGPQGPQGDVGPMGQILEVMSRAEINSTTSCTPDTDATVAFGSVLFDDLSVFTSSTNFTAIDAGDYLFSVYVRFDLPADAGDGERDLWLYSSTKASTIARAQILAVADQPTYLTFSYPVRADASEVFNIKARSGDNLAVGITAGALTVTRIGSGPAGATGPAGPQGPIGATGPAGPQGDPGNASSGFARYDDLY